MFPEYAHHIHMILDMLFAGWLVWLLCRVDALEQRMKKLGG